MSDTPSALTPLDQLRRLWQHAAWADLEVLRALRAVAAPDARIVREYAHVIGAEETWLARLEGRAPRVGVWPELGLDDVTALAAELRRGYAALLGERLCDADLAAPVTYVNSTGRQFTNGVGDILLHVALHGQYHRGKINLMLREDGAEPAPTDFIAFVRGAPAATAAVRAPGDGN